ncbi:hypothetical protein BO443_60060 [Burkholderia orbicola]
MRFHDDDDQHDSRHCLRLRPFVAVRSRQSAGALREGARGRRRRGDRGSRGRGAAGRQAGGARRGRRAARCRAARVGACECGRYRVVHRRPCRDRRASGRSRRDAAEMRDACADRCRARARARRARTAADRRDGGRDRGARSGVRRAARRARGVRHARFPGRSRHRRRRGGAERIPLADRARVAAGRHRAAGRRRVDDHRRSRRDRTACAPRAAVRLRRKTVHSPKAARRGASRVCVDRRGADVGAARARCRRRERRCGGRARRQDDRHAGDPEGTAHSARVGGPRDIPPNNRSAAVRLRAGTLIAPPDSTRNVLLSRAIALGQYFQGVFLSDHAEATTETSRWDGPRYRQAGATRSARCTASSRNTSGS